MQAEEAQQKAKVQRDTKQSTQGTRAIHTISSQHKVTWLNRS